MTPLLPHPLSTVIKPMSVEQREALKCSIIDNGLQVPIVLFQDKILDGNTRYSVCQELGILDFKTKVFEGTEKEAEEFVIASNIHRRHISISVRSCYAVLHHVKNKMGYEEKAKLSAAVRWHGKKDYKKSETRYSMRTIDIVAQKFAVSGVSASKVLTLYNNARDLFDKIMSEEMGMEDAYREHRARMPENCRTIKKEVTVKNFKSSESIQIPDASSPPYMIHDFIDEMVGSGWRMEMKVQPYVGSDMSVKAKYFVHWYGNGVITNGTQWSTTPGETEFRRAVVNSAKQVLTKAKKLIAA